MTLKSKMKGKGELTLFSSFTGTQKESLWSFPLSWLCSSIFDSFVHLNSFPSHTKESTLKFCLIQMTHSPTELFFPKDLKLAYGCCKDGVQLFLTGFCISLTDNTGQPTPWLWIYLSSESNSQWWGRKERNLILNGISYSALKHYFCFIPSKQ